MSILHVLHSAQVPNVAPTMLVFLKTIALGQRHGCNKRIGIFILSEHTHHRLSVTWTLKASNNNTLWFPESEVLVGQLGILSLLNLVMWVSRRQSKVHATSRARRSSHAVVATVNRMVTSGHCAFYKLACVDP